MNQANQNLLHPSRQVGADLAAWRKVGGGEGLLAALADPQSIVSKLQEANLCGMGGAGFPTWRKWEAAVAAIATAQTAKPAVRVPEAAPKAIAETPAKTEKAAHSDNLPRLDVTIRPSEIMVVSICPSTEDSLHSTLFSG
ncbi:hypothetical protein L7A47_35280, partial [Achromobacter xylosoxidans]|nr:hypothetical protein [Achromobacter xylosoxidans]